MTGRSVKKNQSKSVMPKIVDKSQKRIEIARKAMELFAKYGFENTPIRQITAYVGIGKGTFYDYFTDKEDILNEIVQIMFTDWTELLVAKIGRTEDPLKQLFTLLKEGSMLGDTFEQMMIIYVDIWRWSVSHKESEEFVHKFRSFLLDSKAAVTDIIKKAQTKGMIAKELDSAAMASSLIALIDGMCMHHMILKQDFDVDTVCRSFFYALLNGIRP
jgi:AcrR family transcriptional regulator